MSLEDLSGAGYFAAEFGDVRLECEGQADFDVVAGMRASMIISDERDEQCQIAEHDPTCLDGLGTSDLQAVSDAQIALGTEQVAVTWDTPVSGVEVKPVKRPETGFRERLQRLGHLMIGGNTINYRIAQTSNYPLIPWMLPF